MTQTVGESLKFEAKRFKEECFGIFKNLIETNVKKACDEVCLKFGEDCKTSVVQKLEGREMYDYSSFPEIKFDIKNFGFLEIYRVSSSEETIYRINQFKNNVKNEKIVVMYNYSECTNAGSNSSYSYEGKSIVMLTNYAKCFYCSNYNGYGSTNKLNKYMVGRLAEGSSIQLPVNLDTFNFWIPVDYLNVINSSKPKIGDLLDTLKTMKENLYNRKFMPLYIRDIIDENNNLKDKYNKYEKESKEFIEKKTNFEITEKPFLDLVKDKEDIRREKERLRIIAIKLNMDRKKLEEDEQLLKTQIKELNKINVNEELGVE
jgi:hypothetical protein